MSSSPNTSYNRPKPNLTLNLKYILNQDQSATLKSSPHTSQNHQSIAKTPTQAKYAPLRRTPPSTLRKRSLSPTLTSSPQKNKASSLLAASQQMKSMDSRIQTFHNFHKNDQQRWRERTMTNQEQQESYQSDTLQHQKTPQNFGRQSVMTEHHHHRHVEYPASTRHNQVHLSSGSAVTTSVKGLRHQNPENIASQSSLASMNNSLHQQQQSSTYSSKRATGPRNISITHSASGCTTPGGHLALNSISLSEKAKKQAEKAQMVSEFREYGITHVTSNNNQDHQSKNNSPKSLRRNHQNSKVFSSSSSTANKNPINTPQTAYDRDRQRLYELGAFPSGGRVTRAQSGEIQTPFNLNRITNPGIRMSRGQLTQGSPASSSTTMSPPRNNLAMNRTSFHTGTNHLATIASNTDSDIQQQEYQQEQQQKQQQQQKSRSIPTSAVQFQQQNDQLPSSRSCNSEMTERQRCHYQAYEEEFQQNFGRNPHLHSKYIDQIISKMDQKFQTLGAMTRDFEDNQCDLLLFKNKLYRVISDVQNDLRQSANIIHILTQDRIRLKEIFCKQGIDLEKMKDSLNQLKQMHQRIFKQKSLAESNIDNLISQINFHKNQNQKIRLVIHEQANEIARLKRILNQKIFQAEASGIIQQKDMTTLLRENEQLRHQLETSLLERPSSINNRAIRSNRLDSRGVGGGHIHNQTATAAEILTNINTMRSRSYRPLEGTRSALSAFSNYSSLAPNTNRSEFSPRRLYENEQQQQYFGRDADGSSYKPYSTHRVEYDTNLGRSYSANKNNSLRRVQQVIQNMLHLMDADYNAKVDGKHKQSAIQSDLNRILSRRYTNFEELFEKMNNLLGKYQGKKKMECFNPNKNQIHQIMSLFCKIMDDDEVDDFEEEDATLNQYHRNPKSRKQDFIQRSRQIGTSPLQHKQHQQEQQQNNESISRSSRPNKITVGVSPRNSSPRQSVTERIHGEQNFPNQNESEIMHSPSRSMSHWDSPFKGQMAADMQQDEENLYKRKSKIQENNNNIINNIKRVEQQKQQNRTGKTHNLTNISQSDLSRQLSVAMKSPDKQQQHQQQQQTNIIQNFPDSQYNTVSSIDQSQSQIVRGGNLSQNDKNLLIGSGMTLAELKDLLKKQVIAQIIQHQQHNTSNQQQQQSYKNIPQQFHNLQGQSGEISFHSSFNFDSQNQGIRATNAPPTTTTYKDINRKDEGFSNNNNNTPSADDQRYHSYLYSSSKQFTDQLSMDQQQLSNQQNYGMSGNKFSEEVSGSQVAVVRAPRQHSPLNQQLEEINQQKKRQYNREFTDKDENQQVIEVSNRNYPYSHNKNNIPTPSSSSTEQATNLIKVRTRSELSNNQSEDGQQYLNVEYQEFDPDQLAASGGLDTPDYGENKAQGGTGPITGRESVSADAFSSSEGGVGTFIHGSRLNGSQQYDSNSQQSLDLASSGILGSINPGGIRSNQQLMYQFKSEVSVISEKSQSVNTFLGGGGAGKFQSSSSSQHKLDNLQQQPQQQFSDLGTGQGGTFNTADFNSLSNQKYMSSGQDMQKNNQTQKTQELPPDDSLFTISQSQITPKNYSQSGPNAPHYHKNAHTIGGGADVSKLTASQMSESNVVKNIDFGGVSTSNISRHEDDSPQPIQPDSGTASMLLPHMAQGSLNTSEPPSEDSYISNSAQMHIMAVRVGSPPPPRKDDQLEHTSPPRISSKSKLEFISQNQEQQKRRNQQLIIEATQGVKIVTGQHRRSKRPEMLLQDDWEMPGDAEFEGSLKNKTYNSSADSLKQHHQGGQYKNELDEIISASFQKEMEKNFGNKNKTPIISKFITPKEQDDTLIVSADTISPISVGGIITPQQKKDWQKESLKKEQFKEDQDDDGSMPRRQQRLAGYSGEGNKTAIFYQQKEFSGRNSSSLMSKKARNSRQTNANSPRQFINQQSSQNQNTTQQSMSDDFQLLKDIKKQDWPANFYLEKTSQHESFSDDASFNRMQNIVGSGGNKLFRTPQGLQEVTPLMSSITGEKNFKSNAVIEQGAEQDEAGTPLRLKSKVSEFSQTDKQSIQSNKMANRQKKNQQRVQKAKKDAQKAYRHFSPKNSGEDDKGKFQNVDDIFQIANLRESGGSKSHISKNLIKKNVQRVSQAKARLSFSNQGAIRHSNNLSSQNKLLEIKQKLEHENKRSLKGRISEQHSTKRQSGKSSDANQEEIDSMLQEAGKRNKMWKEESRKYLIEQSKKAHQIRYPGSESGNADDEYDQDEEEEEEEGTTALKYRKNRIPSLVLSEPYKKREHSAQLKNHLKDTQIIQEKRATNVENEKLHEGGYKKIEKKNNSTYKSVRKSQEYPKYKKSSILSKSPAQAHQKQKLRKQNFVNKSQDKSLQPQPQNPPSQKPHKPPSKPLYFTFESKRLSEDRSFLQEKNKTASVSPSNHNKNKLAYSIPKLAITSRNANMMKTPRTQRQESNKSNDTRSTSLIASGISNVRSTRVAGNNSCKSPYSRQTTMQGHCSVQRGSTATAVETDSDYSNDSQRNQNRCHYHHQYNYNRYSIGSGSMFKNELFQQSGHQHSLSHSNNAFTGIHSSRSSNIARNSIHLIQQFQNSARYRKDKRGVEVGGSHSNNAILTQYSDILQRGPPSPNAGGTSFHIEGKSRVDSFWNKNEVPLRQKKKQQQHRKDQSYDQGKSTSMILSKYEYERGNKIVEEKTIAKLRERVISPRNRDDGIMNIEAQAKVVTKWNRRDDPHYKLRRSVKHITDPNRKSTPDLSNIMSRVDTGLKKGNNQEIALPGMGGSHTSRDHTPTSLLISKTGGDQSSGKTKMLFQPVRSSRVANSGVFGRKSSTKHSKENLFGENIHLGQQLKSQEQNYKRQGTQSSDTAFFGPGSGQNNSAQNLSSQYQEIKRQQSKFDHTKSKTPKVGKAVYTFGAGGASRNKTPTKMRTPTNFKKSAQSSFLNTSSNISALNNTVQSAISGGGGKVFGERKGSSNIQPSKTTTTSSSIIKNKKVKTATTTSTGGAVVHHSAQSKSIKKPIKTGGSVTTTTSTFTTFKQRKHQNF